MHLYTDFVPVILVKIARKICGNVFCMLMLHTLLYDCTLRHKPLSRKNDGLAAFCFFIEKIKIEKKNKNTNGFALLFAPLLMMIKNST